MARHLRVNGRTTKVGLISGAACCGCGGLAVVLLSVLGVLGSIVAPAPVDLDTPEPSAAVATADASTPTEDATPEVTPSPSPTPDTSTSLGVLTTLTVQARGDASGYDRDLFGWREDTDRNGCDTRNDILRRDLSDIVLKRGTQGCVVLTGTLSPSPYSGEEIGFDREAGSTVDIDHVVSLSDAWQTGASGWDEATRHAFANDPVNLLAVESSLNQQKGDGDAATWLPPNTDFRCEYVSRQVAVKAAYGLWVKPAEKEAIERVLSDCTGQAAFAADVMWPVLGAGDGAREEPEPTPEPTKPPTTRAPAPDPEPTSKPTATPKPERKPDPEPEPTREPEPEPTTPEEREDDGGSAYYKNCTAAREAGAAPLYRGDPGYRPALDRDDDGVACEN
ncbi:hypothetical protein GCM10009793_09220 [Brachybacterium phenoliresistens]